jgi:ribonuclease T2
MIRHVMPSAGLARYQWRKHGMCSGLDEADYFALLVAAAERTTIPDTLTGGQSWSPVRIEAAFADANPGLFLDGMSIQCRGGRFTEIRICMTKDLAFRACDEVDADTCHVGSVGIPLAE